MVPRIEDYALIGDFKTAALVSNKGSIDWLCVPRFDSASCFAKLIGTEDNGFWSLCPQAEFTSTRRYKTDTLILETKFRTNDGVARLTDCMLMEGEYTQILRVVECLEGEIGMVMELAIRFDYGAVIPWVTRHSFGSTKAVAGTNALRLRTPIEAYGHNLRTHAQFTVKKGNSVPFLLTWSPSHLESGGDIDEPQAAIERLEIYWQDWISRCSYRGPYSRCVHRSLITLKALTFKETGGIIAAVTTSLPERMGGERNWDYRYCWLRDSTFTLQALLEGGYREEAMAWRNWLLRAIAGTTDQIQIMYGIGGERDLLERELPWLEGFGKSKPVRIGNAASNQFQLDIFGGVLDSFYLANIHGLRHDDAAWSLARKIIDFVIENWRKPDSGIWEVRGPAQHFTYSKCMCWVVLDRGIKLFKSLHEDDRVKDTDLDVIDKWQAVANQIREDVLTNGYNQELGSFTQAYGSKSLDASTLLISLVGLISPRDPRMIKTTQAIEAKLMTGGFVRRYLTEETADGLSGEEGAFLACSLWLVDNWTEQGEHKKAVALFEKILKVQNDVGLFAEEYDANEKCFLGNFPQAFTHVAILNSAFKLAAFDESQSASCERR